MIFHLSHLCQNKSIEKMAESTMKHIVIVGDEDCGKKTLLKRFCELSINKNQDIPGVFENVPIKVTINGQVVDIALWAAENAEQGKQFGPRACAESDVAVVCFSVDRPESLENVKNTWIPSIQNLNYHTRIVIVGCKTDLRKGNQTNHNVTHVDVGDGEKAASMCGNLEYVECSAMTTEGVLQVLETIARPVLKEQKQRRRCVVC